MPIFVLALVFASIAPQTPAAASPAPRPETTTKTTTFHSDALHLDYTYASSFLSMAGVGDDAIKAEKDKATGVVKQAIDCISLPLTAADSSDGLRLVFLMHMDGKCLGSPVTSDALTTLASSALSQSLARFGDPKVAAASSYQLASHDAAATSGSVKSEKLGVTFYGTASCVIQGSDATCWELLSTNCAALPGMMSYPVTFEGKPAEAVIPAKYAPDCK